MVLLCPKMYMPRIKMTLKQDVLKLLEKTKAQIYLLFEKHNLDAAFFDLSIDLNVDINETKLRVREKQKALQI